MTLPLIPLSVWFSLSQLHSWLFPMQGRSPEYPPCSHILEWPTWSLATFRASILALAPSTSQHTSENCHTTATPCESHGGPPHCWMCQRAGGCRATLSFKEDPHLRSWNHCLCCIAPAPLPNLPSWCGGDELAASAGNVRYSVSISWLGRDPRGGNGTHSRILTWKIHGQRSLLGYTPWGHKELDSPEHACFQAPPPNPQVLFFTSPRINEYQTWECP